MVRSLGVALLCAQMGAALDNGAADTPPMGWLSWERFACQTDCDVDPTNCINSQLYMDMADRLVADGWKDVGYEYVNVDDCWPAKTRDAAGLIQADEKRFPGGISKLCEYIHSKGLKCGLYTDIGATTCGGYLALNVTTDMGNGQFEKDMESFASWGIDSLKVDGCNQDPNVMPVTYPRLGKVLVEAGKKYARPIVYSCSWPAYIAIPGHNITAEVYESLEASCNMWRNWDDISDSWQSVKSIIKWWHDHQDDLVKYAGPGHWNDPDMILAGNTGLSASEYQTQFAFWSIFAAPLLMSNDLRAIDADMKALLQNQDIIAVSQDKLGIEGRCVSGSVPDGQSVWVRSLDGGDKAVVLFNGHAGVPGIPYNITITAEQAGFSSSVFTVYDLLERRPVGGPSPTVFKNQYSYEVPANSVHFIRLQPVSASEQLVV